ncbi:hypothetical protein ABPG72_002318 [Tetrahymena utriculariae]
MEQDKQENQPTVTEEEKKEVQQAQQEVPAENNTLLQTNQWQFWNTQPVPKMDDPFPETSGAIDVIKKPEDVQKDPYNLPAGFEWCNLNLKNQDDLDQLYTLLVQNYVEDDDNMFRFDYSREFLRWALSPPGQYEDWLAGVRVTKTKKLVGFISGIPVHMVLQKKDNIKMTEINFLCVNKKLRSKRLAPVLIKEITRRVNIKNMWQAIYTAGVLIPKPISIAQYFHRSLNPKKLIEINFSSLGKNQTMARVQKLYKLPEETTIQGLRPFTKKDAAVVTPMLNKYLEQFDLYHKFSVEDVKHYFAPVENVIYSYVVESEDKKITDFFSFYCLPSTIINHPKHTQLRAAYSYYHFSTATPLKDLIYNALILAKKYDFDVFNALNLMENTQFLDELLFSPGDGNLHYYLYNWRLSEQFKPSQLGMVLV